MAELWNAFIEDYGNEIHDWTLRLILELFWYYCEDGKFGVQSCINQKIAKLKKESNNDRT